MSLIKKKSSIKLAETNRSNCLKSTGPRTERGKNNSSRNAGTHLIFARVTARGMKELGEDPQDFENLRQTLRDALRPREGFEGMLVEEMAVNRLRLGRLHRAEAGILALQQMKLEHNIKSTPVNRGAGYDNLMLQSFGLSGVSESGEKYVQILQILLSLFQKVEKEGFCAEGLELLETVYGSTPGVTGVGLITQYKSHMESPKDLPQTQNLEENGAVREDFLKNLLREIDAFGRRAKARNLLRDTPLPEWAKDAQLLPAEEDLDRIMRYEAHLERQFQLTLQRLEAWRSVVGRALNAQTFGS